MGYARLNTATPHGEYPSSLGYFTGSRLGRVAQRPGVGFPRALGLLGYVPSSFSPELYQAAVAAGVSESTLKTADALGGQDYQLSPLVQGQITEDQFLNWVANGIQPGALLGPAAPGAGNVQFDVSSSDWAALGVENAILGLDGDVMLLEQEIAAYPSVASAVGSEVAAERAKTNSWKAELQSYIDAAPNPQVITMPDGTQWIGTVDAAGINWTRVVQLAALTAIVGAIVYYHQTTVSGTIAKAQAAQTGASAASNAIASANQLNAQATLLDAQGNAAAAAGNSAQATQLHSQATQARAQANAMLATGQAGAAAGAAGGQPQPPIDWSAWFQKNAIWVGVAAVAIFLGPSLIKRIGR